MTHITYKTAKRLKEFLGESAPEPMEKEWWGIWNRVKQITNLPDMYPAYQLHDLLSKPFCEAFTDKCGFGISHSDDTSEILAWRYYEGGLPEVEKALIQMMEEK